MKLWKHGKDDLNGDLAFYAVIAKRRDSENSETCRAVGSLACGGERLFTSFSLSSLHNHYQYHTQQTIFSKLHVQPNAKQVETHLFFFFSPPRTIPQDLFRFTRV